MVKRPALSNTLPFTILFFENVGSNVLLNVIASTIQNVGVLISNK